MPEVYRKPPKGKSHIQSVAFSMSEWTKDASREWVKGNNGFGDGYEKTENEHRWKQFDYNTNRFSYHRATKNSPSGIYFIMGSSK